MFLFSLFYIQYGHQQMWHARNFTPTSVGRETPRVLFHMTLMFIVDADAAVCH